MLFWAYVSARMTPNEYTYHCCFLATDTTDLQFMNPQPSVTILHDYDAKAVTNTTPTACMFILNGFSVMLHISKMVFWYSIYYSINYEHTQGQFQYNAVPWDYCI